MLSLILAFGALGIQIYMIYEKRNIATQPVVFFPAINSEQAALCYRKSNSSILSPEKFLFGFSLQWDRDLPKSLQSRLDIKPMLYNAFIRIGLTDFQQAMITFHVQETALSGGGILELTADPGVPIESIPDTTYLALAKHLRYLNSKYGVAILLRFGHEMNGGWMTNYCFRPIEYKKAFQTLSRYVRQQTNMTAMLWSPNFGLDYPFSDPMLYPATFPKANDTDPKKLANFNAMDTNGDKVINEQDDPYTPFYPGDEYVDWVGLSLYCFSDNGRGQTAPCGPAIITQTLDGTTPANGFYDRFSSRAKKPMILSETGAPFQSNLNTSLITREDASLGVEISVKQSWWDNIITLAKNGTKYPNFKAAVWFEEIKVEQSFGRIGTFVVKDYRVSYNTSVRAAFLQDLQQNTRDVAFNGNLKATCDGRISIQ